MAWPFETLWMPAALDRAVLLLNHVLKAEPAACERLRAHAGRRLLVQWRVEPGPWPRPPELGLAVTPAGLVERFDTVAADAAELRVTVDLPAPQRLAARWVGGERPALAVEGDAAFAADVAWLAEHLRWDVGADLDRLVGPAASHALLGAARAAAAALGGWARAAGR